MGPAAWSAGAARVEGRQLSVRQSEARHTPHLSGTLRRCKGKGRSVCVEDKCAIATSSTHVVTALNVALDTVGVALLAAATPPSSALRDAPDLISSCASCSTHALSSSPAQATDAAHVRDDGARARACGVGAEPPAFCGRRRSSQHGTARLRKLCNGTHDSSSGCLFRTTVRGVRRARASGALP